MPGWSPVDLLPGIWFGLLALLLLAALARWYDRVPVPVAAAFLLAVIVLFGPALVGGGILLPLDNLRGQAPFRDLPPTEPHGNLIQGDLLQLVAPSAVAVRRAFAEGRWPLWNPLAGAGMPLLGDPQAQALQPLVLLGYPLPWARAAAVTASLRVMVALLFVFLLLRRQGVGAGPALAGAFAFGLSGFLLLWVGWPLANSAALLPAVLYTVVRCDEGGARRDFLLLGIAAASLLLGGHPETVVYAIGLAVAFLLDRARRRPRGRRLPLLREAGLALVLAVGVAAPALFASAEVLPDSLRAARLREGAAAPPGPGARTSLGDRLVMRWLPAVAPNAYGNSRFLHYWGLDNSNEDAGGFVGTAALLAALLALPALRRKPASGIRAAGRQSSPAVRGPGPRGSGNPPIAQERLVLGATALALGLMTLGVAVPEAARRWPALGGGRLFLVVAFGLAYLAACGLERANRGELGKKGTSPATNLTLVGRLYRGLVLILAVALAGVIAWAYLAHPDPEAPDRLSLLRFGWLRWQLRFLGAAALLLVLGRGRRWTAPALAALIAAELVLAHRSANPAAPRRLLMPENAAVAFLAEHLDGSRMAALGRSFPPNLPTLYGLADARVYNPAAPADYVAFTAPITAAWGGEVPELGAPAHPLYRRLGVRYLLAAPGEACPPPLATAFRDASAVICERGDALPRLFVEGEGRFGPIELGGTHVSAGFEAGPGAVLASSVAQDGGWRLLADGERLPAAWGDGPFVTAPLPAGTRRIDLLYRPAGWLAGCVAAALALAAATARWVPPPRPVRSRTG